MTAAPSHFDDTGAQFAWDSTSLKWAVTCQRYYYFQMLLGYRGEKSVHLIFGGHYAAALEQYHKACADGATHDEALVAVVKSALTNSWVHNKTREGVPIPGTGHAQTFDSETKSRESLIRSIVWYLEENKTSEFRTHILANGKAAVEFSFTVDFADGFVYSGHIDRVLRYGDDFFIQDQKTTSQNLSPYYFAQFSTDIQMSGYTFAGRIIYSIPIKGVMIDAARIQPSYTQFLRGFTYRTEGTLNEWRDVMLLEITSIREATQRWRQDGDPSVFRPNFTACGNYGGCPFRPVCSVAPSLRERMLRGNYDKAEIWNPLSRR